MNSSTSNFENDLESGVPSQAGVPARRFRRRTWILGVALTLLLCFVGIECFTRLVLIPRSADLNRLSIQYPSRAQQLMEKDGLKIAFIGNSALDAGVDATIVQETLKKAGIGPVNVQLFPVDATGILDWHFIINHYFWSNGRKPDLIIIPFFSQNLLDGKLPQMGRLSHYFTTTADWNELFTHDITSTSQRVEFVLSKDWLSFGMRERIQHRIMAALVPGYQAFTQNTRTALRERGVEQTSEKRPSPSCHRLERFLRHAREEGTPVWFVAFPGRDGVYELNSNTVEAIRREQMELLDMRTVVCIHRDMYEDWIHMTEIGKKAFSPELAKQVAALIRKHPALNNAAVSSRAKQNCANRGEHAGRS
jgi:hypothetical protein